MTLRKALPTDIIAIMRIDESVLKTNWSEKLYLESMDFEDNYFKVICFETVVMGFILYRKIDEDAEVLQLALAPQYQRTGFGSILMESMFQSCLKCNLKQIYLEVSERNDHAYRFYKKLGFEVIHTRKNYYGEDENALVMRKVLASC